MSTACAGLVQALLRVVVVVRRLEFGHTSLDPHCGPFFAREGGDDPRGNTRGLVLLPVGREQEHVEEDRVLPVVEERGALRVPGDEHPVLREHGLACALFSRNVSDYESLEELLDLLDVILVEPERCTGRQVRHAECHLRETDLRGSREDRGSGWLVWRVAGVRVAFARTHHHEFDDADPGTGRLTSPLWLAVLDFPLR